LDRNDVGLTGGRRQQRSQQDSQAGDGRIVAHLVLLAASLASKWHTKLSSPNSPYVGCAHHLLLWPAEFVT
jgi:hypothetical protein